MYHTLWADWYLPAAMPALERLFFSQVSPGASVLDLCCGSGHITKELVRRGYKVTGVDASAELIQLASKEMSGVDLVVQDVRDLHLNTRFEGILSTFDSLNHILTLEELERAFCGVRAHLGHRGLFVFDMNLEEAYSADLHQWTVDITENTVGLVRGAFNRFDKRVQTELIWFVREGNANLWKQHRSVVEQRCYLQGDIIAALNSAGFREVEAIAARDAGLVSDLGNGRCFFATRHE